MSKAELNESPKVFEHLNFVLQFCPTQPSEKELMERFAKLNLGANKDFDWEGFSPEIKEPNWLTAPEGLFSATLRMYWPKEEALDDRWQLPPLSRVE